jgi:hypothetical protein
MYPYGYGETKGFKSLAKYLIALDNVYIYAFILIISFFQMAYIYYEPVFGDIKVANEFYEIPERTIVNNRSYDNSDYINNHFKSAIWHRWDIRGNCFNNYVNIDSVDKEAVLYARDYRDAYWLDSLRSRIYINSYNYIYPDVPVVNKYMIKLREINKNLCIKRYSEGEEQFLKYNEYELRNQIYERNMFHHQSFMLTPLLQYEKGVPKDKINAQYGYGNIVIFGELMKHIGGVSMQMWLKVLYMTYYVYYLLYVLVLYFVTRSLRFTAILAAIGVFLVNLIDSAVSYRFLYLPPGHFPWRNIFDVSIVAVFYCLVKYKYKRIAAFLILMLSVVSVYINPQIGMMIMLSGIVSLIYYFIREKYVDYLLYFLIVVAVVTGYYLYVNTQSPGDLSRYYLDGVIGFRVDYYAFLLISIVSLMGYMSIMFLNARFNVVYVLYLVIYSQMLLMYYVWQYQEHALLVRSLVYLFAFGLIIYLILKCFNIGQHVLGEVNGFVILLSFVLLISSSVKLYKTNGDYEDIFKNHVSYRWEFEKANIITTINPEYFNSSIKLIEKYSANKDGVYIISQYDILLPFLCGKYSMMPFFDLKWYFVTDAEYNKTLEKLKKDKPEYIYVDKGMDRDMNDDIVDDKIPIVGYLKQESIWRVHRHDMLRKVFNDIKARYSFVEDAGLLSVYKIKQL